MLLTSILQIACLSIIAYGFARLTDMPVLFAVILAILVPGPFSYAKAFGSASPLGAWAGYLTVFLIVIFFSAVAFSASRNKTKVLPRDEFRKRLLLIIVGCFGLGMILILRPPLG